MHVKVLCVGDVVGSPGRLALRQGIRDLVPQLGLDCVIVNAENAAAGSGLTAPLYAKVNNYGANLITLGDHIYRRREIIQVLETNDNVVRPVNLPTAAPGREYAVYQTPSGQQVAVLCVLGRIFMKQPSDCPFAAVDRVLATIPKDIKIILVDVHAEATSEKIAMGWHLDGRVSAVFGTHTHVATADECVLPKGTAYITDVGMTGPHDSVLGRRKDRVLRSLITGVPNTYDVAREDPRLNGAVVTVESTTGLATAIERVRYNGNLEEL